MTPAQVAWIRESWTAVEPIKDVAAGLFYDRLVELDPTLRRLFARTDMAQQKKVLMQTLTVFVKNLDRLDQVVPAVRALGRRHAGYGVRHRITTPSATRSCGRWPGSRRGVRAGAAGRLGGGLFRPRVGHDRGVGGRGAGRRLSSR
jgi:hypothetical protein